MKAVLGIDTSCYTTSCALCGINGAPILQKRKLLVVEQGDRGLRQSEALFQHVRELPDLVAQLCAAPECADAEICAVCASVTPRDADGSYMPVFLAGAGTARSIASAMRVPFYATSHQQGHIAAARIDSGMTDDSHLALHLSGGTTELMQVNSGKIELLGGCDLSAGQFVDRIGVRLGLRFPAGPELEKLAVNGAAESRLKAVLTPDGCSFSGAETQAQRMIDSGDFTPETIAAEVYSCISRTIGKWIMHESKKTGLKSALLAGGVASSKLFRKLLANRLRREDVRLYWGKPEYSGDNAMGVAAIGASRLTK